MANVDGLHHEHQASSSDGTTLDNATSMPSSPSSGTAHGHSVQRTTSWTNGFLQLSSIHWLTSLVRRDDDRSTLDTKDRLTDCQSRRRPWRPSVIRFGPISGILGMALALASIVASLGVLAGSDGQSVSDWSVPPSTLLAIFTAIANLSMRYAALQGVVIAWWVRAMKGSTLAKLHWDWRSGTTLKGALTAGRHMGLLGLACVFSVVVVVDGPLLQRASTIRPASFAGGPSMTLEVRIAPEIPRDYTGKWYLAAKAVNRYPQSAMFNATIPGPNGPVSNHIAASGNEGSSRAVSVVGNWLNGSPVYHAVRGCPGKCKAKIQAPALFETQCMTRLLPVNYSGILSQNEIWGVGKGTAPPLHFQAFAIASALDVSGVNEALILFTGYATLEDCRGIYNYTTCRLESGVGEYEVDIAGNKTTLSKPVVPKYVNLAHNAVVNQPHGQFTSSTLATLKTEMIGHWESAVIYSGKHSNQEDEDFAYGETYEAFQGSSDGGGHCYSWRDPREQVLASLNWLMFYYGANAAMEDPAYLKTHLDPGLETNTTVEGSEVGEHDVFHTEYLWFVGAAIVEAVCIVLVAPTYWGWWKIGRPVSFSPLEMAFEAPMLQACNSNSSGRDLAAAVGEVKVKYGTVRRSSEDSETRITFNYPEEVELPEQGMHFSV